MAGNDARHGTCFIPQFLRRLAGLFFAFLFLWGAACVIQIAATPDDEFLWRDLKMFAIAGWSVLGSMLVLTAVTVILWALTNRLWLAGLLVLVLWLPVALASAAKLSTLGLPVLPSDIFLVGDLGTVYHREFLAVGGLGKFALLAAYAAPMLVAGWFMPRPKLGLWTRLAAAGLAIAFIGSLFWPRTNVFGYLPDMFPKYNWDTKRTYAESGFVVGLAMHCQYMAVEVPHGYSEPVIRKIISDLPPSAAPTSYLRPNVIVILSESFSDSTLFPGTVFGSDPIPTVHQLQKEFGRLDLVSPVFGGLTCNAEFEVLTGMNMTFFPQGTGAYVDYIHRPVPSLASILRQQGYHTVTLHAQGGVHNDTQIQPLLGFEQCVPGAQWVNQGLEGGWMSDDSTSREVIRWADQFKGPYFICVNTIEGHTPYGQDKYGPDSFDVRFTRPLSSEAREILTAYSHGLNNADTALKLLIDHFRDQKDPVLIVFYGDHLPILGDNLLAYRETGFCPVGSGIESLPMHRVQAVIWNNYGKRLTPPSREIGMSQMLPIMLDLLEIPKPPHVRLMEKVGARWPVLNAAGCVDATGEIKHLDQTTDDPLVNEYRLMQHDLLFGQKYFLNDEQ